MAWWWILFLSCSSGPSSETTEGVARGPGITVTEPTDPDGASPLVFEGGTPPAHIVMISIDTLRKSDIGFYGGEADTPFLDGLLAGSVHLEDHMQCSS